MSSSKILTGLILSILVTAGCNRKSNTDTAFYYWKSRFELNNAQREVLQQTAGQQLYLRFFDIKWNDHDKKAYPEAVLNFKEKALQQKIVPVIFITNQTFEKLSPAGADSLALQSYKLLEHLTRQQQITYQTVQFDCDWSLGTKDKFFRFLKSFKTISQKSLEATIRLHQIKYQVRTGVPPVDRGVLMFYNMGKISPDLDEANSIYNAKDAATYVSHLPKYILPLDIALPIFSWSIHIRNNEVIQVYGKIGRAELSDPEYFKPTSHKNVYQAVKSFFMEGIYVKTNDFFKLEEIDKKLLTQAAEQLAEHLNKKEKRTIIYYELGNLNLSTFKTSDFKEVSAHF